MTMPAPSPEPPARERAGPVVVVGDGHLARTVCAGLTARGRSVAHLTRPDDAGLRAAMGEDCSGVAVLHHDDHAALRWTLVAAHVDPKVPLVSSVFDATVAGELRRMLEHTSVSTPGNLVSPSLAGPCVGPGVLAASAGRVDDAGRWRADRRLGGVVVRRDGDGLVTQEWAPTPRERWAALLGRLSGQLRPHDPGSRILLAGLVGLLAVLLADFAYLVLRLHHGAALSFFDAARVVATVGPAAAPEEDRVYLVGQSLAILVTVVLTAAFTAGLVERLLGHRLVGLVGRRTVPRRGHVVVVGLGQVGLRLCQELRGLGLPVVAVERRADAPSVRIARRQRIPVVVADGQDRAVLERLALRRARALAAVGSDDLDNVAVAVAAHAVAPGVRVVLRAGQHEAVSETRSLLPLGTTRDVTAAAGAWVVATLDGQDPRGVVATAGSTWLDLHGSGYVRWPAPEPARCGHETAVPADG